MLPLEGILFVPSLLVAPLALAALFFLREKSQHYPRIWRFAVVVCFVLCGLFVTLVLSTPLYSERDHSPDNPGGFSTGVSSVIGVFLLMTCIVIPAFPVLIGLTFLPPHDLRSRNQFMLVVFSLLYLSALAWLIAQKNAAFVADYHALQLRERAQGDQFKHLRGP